MGQMKNRYMGLGAVLFLGLLVSTALLMRPRAVGETPPKSQETTKPANTSTPKTPTLEQNAETEGDVRLTGMVVSSTKATLSARMPARIERVLVKEGQSVTPQTPLIQLDTTDFIGQVRVAEAGLKAAQAQLNKAQEGQTAQRIKADGEVATAKAGLRQAQLKQQQAVLARDALNADATSEKRLADEGIKKAEEGLEIAKRTRQSLEELAKVGGVSRNDLEGARAQERIAASDLSTARTQRKRLDAGPSAELSYRISLAEKDIATAKEGVRQAQEGVRLAEQGRGSLLSLALQDIQAARAALQQALAGLQSAQAALGSMRLVSSISGVVTALQAREGETAQPGMPLLTVVSLAGLHIEALVSARHLANLPLGQSAQAFVDTQSRVAYSLQVMERAQTAEPDGRTFRVKFRVLNPTSLLPGQVAHIRLPRKSS
jgi:HlyD family secretion protein